MGKGSNRRREDVKKVRDNWDKIFGQKDRKEEKPNEQVPNNNAK